jgi:type III secretory pathway component EscV
MKLYLDDIRFPRGSGWSIARNAVDFQYMYEQNKKNITAISFDHDLGTETTGYDCLKMVEEDIVFGHLDHAIELNVHSANPVAIDKMKLVINTLREKYPDVVK